MNIVLLSIFENIPCDNERLCPYGVVQDTLRVFQDYRANNTLIILSAAICCSIASFQYFSIATTKNASAA